MAWGPGSTYLWGYTPYLNVFLCRAAALNTGPVPNCFCLREARQLLKTKTDNGKTSSPFFLDPPPTCPYRPLISYKIGQMPTVTRGG